MVHLQDHGRTGQVVVSFRLRKIRKGEEPMKYFHRIDKIVGVLASLGVVKTVADVNRNIIMSLTSDYKMEERTSLYRENVTRAEITSIIPHGTCSFPRRRARTWARRYFRMGLLEVVVQAEAGMEVTVSQEVEVTRQTRTASVAVTATT